MCRAANSRLDHALGSHLVKRYGKGALAADVLLLQVEAQVELWNSNDTDIEITLASLLEKVLGFVADDESAPPGLGELAQSLRPNAEQVWVHYGGDSGAGGPWALHGFITRACARAPLGACVTELARAQERVLAQGMGATSAQGPPAASQDALVGLQTCQRRVRALRLRSR